jgi:predicted ATPase
LVITLIDKVFLENFKGFKRAEFELKPITVLVGPNNGGKSSLIQSIILIQQTLLGISNSAVNLSGQKNFGYFKDLVNQKSEQKKSVSD